jgi:hypothetical protein
VNVHYLAMRKVSVDKDAFAQSQISRQQVRFLFGEEGGVPLLEFLHQLSRFILRAAIEGVNIQNLALVLLLPLQILRCFPVESVKEPDFLYFFTQATLHNYG